MTWNVVTSGLKTSQHTKSEWCLESVCVIDFDRVKGWLQSCMACQCGPKNKILIAVLVHKCFTLHAEVDVHSLAHFTRTQTCMRSTKVSSLNCDELLTLYKSWDMFVCVCVINEIFFGKLEIQTNGNFLKFLLLLFYSMCLVLAWI